MTIGNQPEGGAVERERSASDGNPAAGKVADGTADEDNDLLFICKIERIDGRILNGKFWTGFTSVKDQHTDRNQKTKNAGNIG